MARFVLVHGAFGGAWCWEPVVERLRAAGHEAEAFDLPGAGSDPTPLAEVTLARYAARVCEALGAGPPAVLAGQSMGGMAITQAAADRPDRVAALAYVSAFLPWEGASLTALTHEPEAAGDAVQANLSVEGDPPIARLDPEAAVHAIYTCADPDRARAAAAR
ncbi:MAG: alpha/beta fold hydrolase, partial [Solirubrobacteraceae bacterium]